MKTQIIIFFTLFFSLIGFSQTFTVDDIVYNVTSTNPNTVEITDYTGSGGDVVIPSISINNTNEYSVTSIGSGAFFLNNNLTSVTIPNSVTSIGRGAFAICNLSSVTIGNNVANIGSGAFRNNNLDNITIPNSVTTIGADAFEGNKLTSLTIPNNVTSIGKGAFENNQLTSIVSEGIIAASIDSASFGDRSTIDLTILKGTLYSSWTGFKSITTINTFTIDNIVYEITSLNPNTVKITDYIGLGGDIVIPETIVGLGNIFNVTSIVDLVFMNKQLTSVVIPNSVTSIGFDAFRNNNLTSVTISDSVTSIGFGAFRDNNLTSVTIPDSLTTIPTFMFLNNSLTDIIIPDSVITIGQEAFQNNKLTNVSLGSSLTTIGFFAFANNKLTSIIIPDTVTSTKESFINNNLTSITYTSNISSIGGFSGNDLISIIIPNTVTSIKRVAFESNKLTNIVIPNSVTSIGERAFESNKLTNIVIPNSVTSIEKKAFSFNNLISVTSKNLIPPTIVTGAEDDTFDDRSEIDLIVPVGTLQAYIDEGWTGFKSITEDDVFLSLTSFNIENQISYFFTDNSFSVIPHNSIQLNSIALYDLTGKKIITTKENKLLTSTLSSGVYLVKIDTSKGVVTKKYAR